MVEKVNSFLVTAPKCYIHLSESTLNQGSHHVVKQPALPPPTRTEAARKDRQHHFPRDLCIIPFSPRVQQWEWGGWQKHLREARSQEATAGMSSHPAFGTPLSEELNNILIRALHKTFQSQSWGGWAGLGRTRTVGVPGEGHRSLTGVGEAGSTCNDDFFTAWETPLPALAPCPQDHWVGHFWEPFPRKAAVRDDSLSSLGSPARPCPLTSSLLTFQVD